MSFSKTLRKFGNKILNLEISKFLSDEQFVKLRYYFQMGEKLNLEKPMLFNEKLNWLKIYDKNPLYKTLVHKGRVREFISQKVGNEFLIPSFGEYRSFDEVDFNKLPESFVIKAAHTSGDFFLVNNKNDLDINEVENSIKLWMKKDFYWKQREWCYKDIESTFIIEKFLIQEGDAELKDFRFFCFNGQPKFVIVDFSITDKKKVRRNIYDLSWNLLPYQISYPNENNIKLNKPDNFEIMIEVSKKLSANIPFSRIDLYNIEGKIYFGEITLYHQGGLGKVSPLDFNQELGDLINLEGIIKDEI